MAPILEPVYSIYMASENDRTTDKQVSIPRWTLVTLGILLCLSFLVIGIGIGISGAVPQSIEAVFASATHTSEPAPHLSQEAILQVINNSIQSSKPLYLVGDNLSGANLFGAYLLGADLRQAD